MANENAIMIVTTTMYPPLFALSTCRLFEITLQCSARKEVLGDKTALTPFFLLLHVIQPFERPATPTITSWLAKTQAVQDCARGNSANSTSLVYYSRMLNCSALDDVRSLGRNRVLMSCGTVNGSPASPLTGDPCHQNLKASSALAYRFRLILRQNAKTSLSVMSCCYVTRIRN